MPTATKFDVLIVYSERTANSASHSSLDSTLPFPTNDANKTLNYVYSYFIEACKKIGLSAAFTTSEDITGPGTFRSYWKFVNDQWIKVHHSCTSNQIFDKFSPVSLKIKNSRALLFSKRSVKQFNNKHLFDTFFDKQKTYNVLQDFAIPTVSLIQNTQKSITQACSTLRQIISTHPGKIDFTQDIIMKDRFGAGGWHVYRFQAGDVGKMSVVMKKNPLISFIIQPFANFDLGFAYQDRRAATDIRLIYLGDKLVQSYFRMAKDGDFRCNEHQGGTSTYLKLSEIPKEIVIQTKKMIKIIGKGQSLYSLDFIMGNSGRSYFLEGNIGPGLSWNKEIKYETFMARKLIRMIAQFLKEKISTPQIPSLHIRPARSPFLPTAKNIPYLVPAPL